MNDEILIHYMKVYFTINILHRKTFIFYLQASLYTLFKVEHLLKSLTVRQSTIISYVCIHLVMLYLGFIFL